MPHANNNGPEFTMKLKGWVRLSCCNTAQQESWEDWAEFGYAER
jgi:hypothetical protein